MRNLIKRAYVSNTSKDSESYNIIQVTYFGDKTGDAEVINPYGLYTNLPKDIQVLLFSGNSNEENRACIGYSQDDRFKNLDPEGEVVTGNPKSRAFIKFDKNGNIEINAPEEINIKAKKVNIDADETNLGVGGAKIARLGDEVTVNSDIGTITGSGDNTSI